MSKQTQADISRIAKEIGELVVQKNIAYGDSAVDPVRIFSKASPVETATNNGKRARKNGFDS